MNKHRIESKGVCECIYEPRGDHGLEGYQRNDKYFFEKAVNNDTNKVHFRIYPTLSRDNYYECCRKGIFKRHFNIVKEFNAIKPN